MSDDFLIDDDAGTDDDVRDDEHDGAATDDVAELEAQLYEKEELVAALTERLEQAAEQLDRFRRTGADRGGSRGGGGSLPADLVEEQRQLADGLKRAVDEWEASQPTAALGRIESRLSELHNLVSNLSGTDFSGSSGAGTAFDAPASSDSGGDEDLSGLSSYEALKASLGMTTNADPSSAPAAPESGSAPSGHAPSQQPQENIAGPDPVDPPAEIDLDAAEPEALRTAVEERDNYIAYLIRKLRVAETRAGRTVDWAALNEAPEELQTRLQELEGRLDEMLRMAEVEFSLERARLGREAMRLEHLEHQIAKQQKRLNMSAGADGETPPDGDSGDDSEKGNRWMRMLGR